MAAQVATDDEMITGINVTPLVDIVLVLLVVLMVTASYVVSQSIPVDLPKGATAETVPTTISISVDAKGGTYLDGARIEHEPLRARIRAAFAANHDTRAIIAADGGAHHRDVVAVIDLLRQEGVDKFAINVEPEMVPATETGS